jgi:hypothetical protein
MVGLSGWNYDRAFHIVDGYQANADIWIATRKEKLLWAGEFCVEDIRSHSADQKVQYLHIFEKCTPQQMASRYAGKWAKAYLKNMRNKREFVSARPVAIEKRARWRLYHKGGLWLVQSPSELNKLWSITFGAVLLSLQELL